MIKFNSFICIWIRKLLVILFCDVFFFVFEINDVYLLVGIVDLLGILIFVEMLMFKKWKFKIEEIICMLIKFFFLLWWSVIYFIFYKNLM